MKPSHRKDVIIARIIFAFICLALIGIIVGIVVLISSHHKNTVKDNDKQTESQKDDVNVPVVSDFDVSDDSQSEDSQTGDSQTGDSQSDDSQKPQDEEAHVMVTEGVRLRQEPSTDSEILAVCPPGVILKFISEQDGWTKVDYEGQIGYVSSEFLVDAPAAQ